MPLGVYGQLLNAIGSKRPGIITHVGLNTYADPRQDGCKMNALAKADGREMVELIHVSGKDYLFYKAFHIDACILHASYADTEGNISLQNEPVHGDLLELALAVHNNGGIVIVEVNSICEAGALDPRHVLIHKSCVDYIVKAEGENNVALAYHPEMVGDIRGLAGDVAPLPFGYKKVIARRAAMELRQGALVNLGIGIPASVANVANEEGLSRDVTLSLETGVFGGVPLDGPLFGAAVNPDSISRSADTFSLYDGGGLDMTVLGCAEVDATGNVNVSKFSGRCVGPGGFVNISQNTPKICFAFAFNSGKCDIGVEDGKLVIRRDGRPGKFIPKCDHITFSSQFAQDTHQEVLFITERAVFRLVDRRMILTEIAPGVDLRKDILDQMGFAPEISPSSSAWMSGCSGRKKWSLRSDMKKIIVGISAADGVQIGVRLLTLLRDPGCGDPSGYEPQCRHEPPTRVGHGPRGGGSTGRCLLSAGGSGGGDIQRIVLYRRHDRRAVQHENTLCHRKRLFRLAADPCGGRMHQGVPQGGPDAARNAAQPDPPAQYEPCGGGRVRHRSANADLL